MDDRRWTIAVRSFVRCPWSGVRNWHEGSIVVRKLAGVFALCGVVVLAACAGPGPTVRPAVTPAATPANELPVARPPAPPASTARVPIEPATATAGLPLATPTAAPPSPTAIPPVVPTAVAGTPAPLLSGTLITQTAHLDLYRLGDGLAAATLLDLAPQLEAAIERVGARMGAQLLGRVALSFEPPQQGPCALRGLTRSHERIIRLYYAPDTPVQRVLPIVAHELAHQLQHDYYGWEAHRRSDVILLEGQATWASGDYALGANGRPVWASQAAQALAEGRLLPLTADLEADCRTATRNTAYTGWASFVEFLITTYGRERFDAVYRSGRGRDPGSADYAGVYGKDLAALDQEWRAWLATGGS